MTKRSSLHAIAAVWLLLGFIPPTAYADPLTVQITSGTLYYPMVNVATFGIQFPNGSASNGTWSRHDVKAKGHPGIHSMVFYADDEYVLGKSGGPTAGWKDRLPEVREGDLGPALEVYSIRRDRWLRVRSIPRENVIEFGWTSHPGVSIQCDTRRYARAPVMPLEMCTWPDYGKAAPGGYELGYTFNEPGAPLRFVIRKNQLDAAFDWLGER